MIIPVKWRWTWPGVTKPSGRGCSQGRRTSLTSGRANHNCQQALAISQVHRSAASVLRGRTVVQPRVCLRKRKACSTVKRRKYQRHSTLKSVGSGPPNPGQPQGSRRQLLVGQALDLDTHHAERSIWGASHVELGPDVDPDLAVGGVE